MLKIKRLAAAFVCAVGLSTVGITFTAVSHASASTCVDHADQGTGNFGDPGDGGNHHNEDVGKGNNADPGNAGNKACATDQ